MSGSVNNKPAGGIAQVVDKQKEQSDARAADDALNEVRDKIKLPRGRAAFMHGAPSPGATSFAPGGASTKSSGGVKIDEGTAALTPTNPGDPLGGPTIPYVDSLTSDQTSDGTKAAHKQFAYTYNLIDDANGGLIMGLMMALWKEALQDRDFARKFASDQALAKIAVKMEICKEKLQEIDATREDIKAKYTTDMVIGFTQLGVSALAACCASSTQLSTSLSTLSNALGTIDQGIKGIIDYNSDTHELKKAGERLQVVLAKAEKSETDAKAWSDDAGEHLRSVRDMVAKVLQALKERDQALRGAGGFT